MVAAAAIIFRAFLKMLRSEEEEKREERKPRTLRQSLISGLALIIIAFLGFFILSVMDHLMDMFQI